MTAPTSTLAESLLAITAKMPKIAATGKSPFDKNQPALSIGDVEDAVRPLLIEHGVLIRFRVRELRRADRDWQADVSAVISGAGEEWVEDWADCGGTPSAAYSFARKSYLKALFHIADSDDHSAPPTAGATRARSAAASAPPAANEERQRVKVLETIPTGRSCPDCGDGDLVVKRLETGAAFVSCTNYPTCKHTEKVEQVAEVAS